MLAEAWGTKRESLRSRDYSSPPYPVNIWFKVICRRKTTSQIMT